MTPRENACLIAIRDMTVDGVSPTLEELQFRLGLSSKSRVHVLISGLEADGYLRRTPEKRRNIVLIERGGGSVSDARIAARSDEALESTLQRISKALSHRRSLSQTMLEAAA